ncbi:MAG: TlpA family protein disulfide reductase [Flavobacteriales bacterium]|nr:TlpA family protein disulfide reductase [Flavobacteriales bacterium]
MKNISRTLLIALLAVVAASCGDSKGDKWTVEVKMKDGGETDQVNFSYLTDKQKDTTINVVNGVARLEESFIDPTYVNITVLPEGKEAAIPEYSMLGTFINSADEHIVIDSYLDSLYIADVRGGMYELPSYDILRKINKESIALQRKYLLVLTGQSDMSQEDFMKEVEELSKLQLSGITSFIKENNSLPYSAYLLINVAEALPIEELKAIYETLADTIKNHELGQSISYVIASLDASVKEGMEAPAFTVKDVEDKTLSLEEYKGKWVILDFWGSWCGPCRQSNPHLVSLYKKYHKKGLEIIGLALSDTREKSVRAMTEDGITWRNAVINEQEDETAKNLPVTYRITGVPTKILIDPNGVVQVIEVGVKEESEIEKILKENLK